MLDFNTLATFAGNLNGYFPFMAHTAGGFAVASTKHIWEHAIQDVSVTRHDW